MASSSTAHDAASIQDTSSIFSQETANSTTPLAPRVQNITSTTGKTVTDHDLQHFTATGRPLPRYQHDGLSSVAFGDSGVGGYAMASGPANILPRRYTDESFVTIPIPKRDLIPASGVASSSGPGGESTDEVIETGQKKKKGFLGFGRRKDREGGEDGVIAVRMRRGDYLAYWAKGEDGRYLDDVVEPPGGRAEWIRKLLEEGGDATNKGSNKIQFSTPDFSLGM